MAFRTKHGLMAPVVALAAAGGYLYYSPYLAIKAMRSAAQHQDAEAFNEHVDYPRLRESFKGQMSAMMAKRLGDSPDNGAQTFGALLGLVLVNQMVEGQFKTKPQPGAGVVLTESARG